MKNKEVQGIGGFLLVYIIVHGIGIVTGFLGVESYYNIYNRCIYYMPWNEGAINFVSICFICWYILNFISVVMLIFKREKFVIKFLINCWIFGTILGILEVIIFSNICNIDIGIFSLLLSLIYPSIIICYFKKSKRVRNTYCKDKNYKDNESEEKKQKSNNEDYTNSEDNKQKTDDKSRVCYYSSWEQYAGHDEENYNDYKYKKLIIINNSITMKRMVINLMKIHCSMMLLMHLSFLIYQ